MEMHQTAGHRPLTPGIYLSQRHVAPMTGSVVTTFSILMTEPSRERVMGTGETHTIEHLGQALLGNDLDWGCRVVHFGPLGSRTGFSLVVLGDWEVQDVLPLVRCMFEFIAGYDGNIPRMEAGECGNPQDHDLPKARERAAAFIRAELSTVAGPCFAYAS